MSKNKRKEVPIMRGNRNIKRGLTASLAVGMSVMMGAVPVCAAAANGTDVYKEESVYVNADAQGTVDQITVSSWLKNAGTVKGNLEDESELNEIKNVKGEESFSSDGKKLTWNTDGQDIYYQGTTNKELPVSVTFTYFLDGKEVKPEKIKGQSGHLTIQIQYKNEEKKTVLVDGKEEEVYTPFVMMTGMILSNEHFQNVVIDNGKVISDGNNNIVVGFGMPGMKESLKLSDEMEQDLTIPESLEIEADVTDFTMSSTYTVALTDLLDDLDLDEIVDVDSLQDSLEELEDAALALVSGSAELADGAKDLDSGVDEYTKGVDTLNAGIQKYLGKNGKIDGSVTEYVNGVNKAIQGVKDYTEGADALADGVTAYVAGEGKLAEGAAGLSDLSKGLTLVQTSIDALNKALDGKDEDDIKAAAEQLAAGTKQLKETLGTKEVKALLAQVDSMVSTGNELITETGKLSASLQKGIAEPVGEIAKNLTTLQTALGTINTSLTELQSKCQKAVDAANEKIDVYNNKVDAAKKAASNSKTTIEEAISSLETQLNNTTDETAKTQLKNVIDTLKTAKTAADGLSSVEKAEKVTISMPTIDTSAITSCAAEITTSAATFKNAAEALNEALPEMQKKLNSISAAKDAIPADSIEQLGNAVETLNTGMQALNKGIAELSGKVSLLDTSVAEQFPEAIEGIKALNAGFTELGANNEMLTTGASDLKDGTKEVLSGLGSLEKGTTKLTKGISQLGKEMSSGSEEIAKNSNALRKGASALLSGAKELANGMETFDKEGTSKLKDTVEDELGDVIDRMKALTSEECGYDTFSGKNSSMEGSVKFIIATDAVE